MAGKIKLKCPYFHGHLKALINSLLSSGDFADVTILCGGQQLRAHKLVLSACSPYFRTLFLNNPQKNLIMTLTNTEFENFKIIFDFMYNGEAHVSVGQLSGVMDIVRKYQIEGLVVENGADQASKGPSAMTSSESSFHPSTSQTRSETPYAQNNHNSASSHKKSGGKNPSARMLSKAGNLASCEVPGISEDIPANAAHRQLKKSLNTARKSMHPIIRLSPYHSTTVSEIRPKGKIRIVGDPSKSLQQTPVTKNVANVFSHFEVIEVCTHEPAISKGVKSLPSFATAFSNR